MNAAKRILITSVYFPAHGHVVEAIELASNYRNANPDSHMALVVGKSPGNRALQYCPWLDEIIEIDCNSDIEPQLQKVSPDWDYVIHPRRLGYEPEKWYPASMLHANTRIQQHFRARCGSQFDQGELISGERLPSQLYSRIRMELPRQTTNWVEAQKDGSASPTISLLLHGSFPVSAFPSLAGWTVVVQRILHKFPNAEFWLTGVSAGGRYGWQSAEQRNRAVSEFADAIPQMKNFIDVGFEKQLGLIAGSDVFLGPHTGFSFYAPCLGTPWLAASGGSWEDYQIGDVPFYSSLPPCECYPCAGRRKFLCRVYDRLHRPTPCVGSSLEARADDIVKGLNYLLAPAFNQQRSFEVYRELAVSQGLDINSLWRLRMYFDHLENASTTP